MVFSSSVFLFGFLPFILVVYYGLLRTKRTAQNLFLFIASLGFYAWGEPAFVFVMLLSIATNWLFGLQLDRRRGNKRRMDLVVVAAIIVNFGFLFVFKYLMFTMENINLFLRDPIIVPIINLPIGISFFTFQAFSYILDVYRDVAKVQKNIVNLGLYISFFPQLIAGPIVRYETVAEQIMERKETISDFAYGIKRFVIGFCKKVLIANNVAIIADTAFSLGPNELSFVGAWVGIVSYTLQIFFDFSGYSDMAIGLGKMFGFHFLENFDFPYIARSISEFWRRWHISLGTWFRDYVYFPLGGSRVNSKWRLVFNLFVVWMFTGIWHGANWTFIIWGALYFILITIEKLFLFEKKTEKAKIWPHVYTLSFVMIGWVIFRANDVTHAISYIKALFLLGSGTADVNLGVTLTEAILFLSVGIVGSVPVRKFRREEGTLSWSWTSYALYLMMFIIAIAYVVKGSYNPFIYFNF